MFSAKTQDVLSNLAAKTAQLQEQSLTPTQRAASAARGIPLSGPDAGGDDFSWAGRPSEDTAAFAGAFDQLNQDRVSQRTGIEAVTDTAVTAIGGAVQGLTSIAAIPDNLLFQGGMGTRGFSEDVRGIQDNLTSRAMRERNAAVGELGQAHTRDFDRRGVTGMERVFADMDVAGELLSENLSQVPQGIANAGGSLLAGGLVSKGVRGAIAGGSAILRNPAVAAFIAKYGDEVAGAIGMGSMEAGGAGLQAAETVNNLSHDALMTGNDFYATYLSAHGDTPEAREAARRIIGSRAANRASLIQAPAAILGGALTGKIVRSPFAAGSVRTSLANIGKEAMEEAMQEGMGNISANAGVRSFADDTQALEEGVGRGIIEGAVFGGLSVGTMQTPGTVARRSVERTVQGFDAVMARGERINNANAVKANEMTSEAVNTAAAPINEAPVDDSVITEQDQAEFETHRAALDALSAQFDFDQVGFTPESEEQSAFIATLDPEKSHTIVDVMLSAADRINSPEASPVEKAELAMMIFDLRDRVTKESMKQVTDLKGQVTPGGRIARETTRVANGFQAILSNKNLEAALRAGMEATPPVTVADVEDVSTPEGQQAARKVAVQALISPETADPEVLERLFKHSTKRPELFSPNQALAIRNAPALNKTFAKAKADAEAMGLKPPLATAVSADIQSLVYDPENPKDSVGPSVKTHYDRVIEGLSTEGDGGQVALSEFRNFAQHMANKLTAVNQSFTGRVDGKTKGGDNPQVAFDKYSPSLGEWQKGAGKVGVVRFGTGSIAFGQQVGVDAEYVIDTYNALVAQNPQLGLTPVDEVRLDAGLRKLPREVIAASRAEQEGKKPVEQTQQKQPDPKPDQVKQAVAKTEPAPKAEPVKEPEPEEQLELPLSRIEPKDAKRLKDAELIQRIALIADRVGGTTEQASDKATLAVLRSEQDAREEALISEASTVVEDTAVPPVEQEAAPEVAEPEAKPEVQATEEAAPVVTEQIQTLTIDEVFPNLLADTNGEQLLRDGFTMDNEARTRLVGQGAVSANDVAKAFASAEAYADFTKDSTSKLTDRAVLAYRNTIAASFNLVFNVMTERLANSTKFNAIENGKPITNMIRRVDMRLLNLMERVDGKLKYTDTVRASAMLAFADWLAQGTSTPPARDDEDVAKKLRIDILDVQPELVAKFNRGMASQQAHESLARTLTKFMGLKAKSSVRNGLTDGLILSLAAELLDAAEEAKLIITEKDYSSGTNFVFMRPNREALGLTKQDEDGPSFEGQVTLISQAVTQDTSAAGWSLNKPEAKPNARLRGGGATTSAEQKATELRENAVAQTVNMPMLDVVRKLAEKGMVALFANGELLPTLNKKDRESKEGQNLGISAAYETVMGLIKVMEREALKTGTTLDKVKLFREYVFTSVNRLMQTSQHGDQSSKVTRELITPYGVTLDLTDAPTYAIWRRAIAQGLGVKVERKQDASWEADLDKELAKPEVQAAIEMLKDYDNTSSEDMVSILKAAGVKDVVQLHVLQSLAAYETSTDRSNFETHVYIEADGVTDGPTNSLLYFRLGGFDVSMVQGLKRGGLIFSAKPTPLADIFDAPVAEGQDKFLDTYELGGKEHAAALPAHMREVVGDSKELQQVADDVWTVMSTMLGDNDFSFTRNEKENSYSFTVGRKQLKNPLTITIYGSSASGIADKLAKELYGALYSKISDANALATADGKSKDWLRYLFINDDDVKGDFDVSTGKMATFLSALDRLAMKEVKSKANRNAKPGERQREYLLTGTGASLPTIEQMSKSAVDLEFDTRAVKGLASALRVFYVDPMVTAINKSMGSSVQGSELIQKSTNMLSSLAKAAFDKLVGIEIEKLGTLTEGLSPDQLKQILSKVQFLLPYLEGDTVSVNVRGLKPSIMAAAARTKADGSASKVRAVHSITGESGTELTVSAPGLAGVAGAAYVNISYGDGRMIISASPGIIGGRLMVYDGINLALKDAVKNGRAINAAVLSAIQTGTPFADLFATFKEVSTTLGNDFFNDAELTQIFRDTNGRFAKMEAKPAEQIGGQIYALHSQLFNAAMQEKARQAVLARVHLSSDHMAAIGAPASTATDTNRINLRGLSDQEVAQRLNALYTEELQKLKDQVVENRSKAPTEDLSPIMGLMEPDTKTGVRVTSSNSIRQMLKDVNLPTEHLTVIRRALLALEGTNWTVVFGNAAQATAYTKAEGIGHSFGVRDHGLMVPSKKTIIVASNSSETLAHELIHAATIDKLDAFYEDPARVDENTQDAIQRLELLMDEWRETILLTTAARHARIREAAASVISDIEMFLKNGDKAGALNEFIAWNLANQDLMKINSNSPVENKLALIAKGIVSILRNLFGLPSVGRDMASNIRFNAMILMSSPKPEFKEVIIDRMMFHRTGQRPDLDRMRDGFMKFLRQADVNWEKTGDVKPSSFALEYGDRLAMLAGQYGFKMTNEERAAFGMVIAAYRVNKVIDPKSEIKLNAYHREVIAQMSEENMTLGDPNDPGERELADRRMRLLSGAVTVGEDIRELSLLMPMFLALGATNSTAQELFSRIKVRDKKAMAEGTTADDVVKGFATRVMDGTIKYSLGLKPNQQVDEEVANIANQLVKRADAERTLLNQVLEMPGNFIREANEFVTDRAADALEKGNDGVDFLVEKAKGTPMQDVSVFAGNIVKASFDVMNKRRVDEGTASFTSLLDRSNINQEWRGLFTELMGVNEGNVDILGLVKIARATIHKVRQTFRKLMPELIAKEFSRTLTPKEWENLYFGLGNTDLRSLMGQGLSSNAVIALLGNPAEVSRLVAEKEAAIRRLYGADAPTILTEAGDLAYLMVRGRPRHGSTKRNAMAIANRVGTASVGSLTLTSEEVQTVDAFASLVALRMLPPETLKSLSDLSGSEAKGMADVLSLMNKAYQSEMDRVPARLRFNVPKGYLPHEKRGSFQVVSADRVNDFTRKGYKVMGNRQAGAIESLYASSFKGQVYVASDIPPPSFKQGIIQTVRATVFGLDAVSGARHDTPSAGLITDPTAVKRITLALRKSNQEQTLAPLYNEAGSIYAYERLVDPVDVEAAIEVQYNAAVSIGQWMGRQHEEEQSKALNAVTLKRLLDMYENDTVTAQQTEYVDLFELAKTDPVVSDALQLMADQDVANIYESMGGKFMVKRSLYENVIGYRAISIGDLWSGNTRVSEETRDSVANFLTGIFGPETYRRLTVAEQGWQNLMGDARVAIVVKSVLVPVLNGTANFFQLMANGIGPVDIVRMSGQKLRETHLYAQNYLKYQELSAKLASAEGAQRPDRARLIETEMRKIEDLNKRLSIWPLIAAGEFTQITEGLTQDDMEMTKGRIWDYVSKLADKLPTPVKTAGRYAIVAKDTALFEGLARTVSYTDFVAKAVLYEHLTTKMKKPPREAMLRITNEFVNYDLLGGRMRSKAEEAGLLWFWSFKIRAIKVAMSMVRNNPLHAFLTGMVPGIEGVGTPIDDNGITLIQEGRGLASFGPENALKAITLNPLGQVIL